MYTNRDQNSQAELMNDLANWDAETFDQPCDRAERFDLLWSEQGFYYFGKKITIEMVFEHILNEYPDEDIDASVLHYAMAYPESKWYGIIRDVIADFVEEYEE